MRSLPEPIHMTPYYFDGVDPPLHFDALSENLRCDLAIVGGGVTGLSDSMSPGAISRLSRSDAIAFRVQFETGQAGAGSADGLPAPAERYWRGPTGFRRRRIPTSPPQIPGWRGRARARILRGARAGGRRVNSTHSTDAHPAGRLHGGQDNHRRIIQHEH